MGGDRRRDREGKKSLFYNGEELYDHTHNNYQDERRSWEMIIVLPGVK